MPDNHTELRKQARRAIVLEDAHLAFDVIKKLEERLAQADPQNVERIQNMERARAQLMAIAMRYYSADTLADVFENHIVDILYLPEDIDLVELLKRLLVTEDFIATKNEIKSEIRKSIERSTNRLGHEKINLGNNRVEPTIENWIKLFTSETGNSVSSVEEARFLTQNADVLALSPKDQERLRRLVRFYTFLKQEAAQEVDRSYIQDDPEEGLLILDEDGKQKIFDEETLRELERQARNKELYPKTLTELQLRFPDRFGRYEAKQYETGGVVFETKELQQRTEEFFAQAREQHAGSETKRASNKLIRTAANLVGIEKERVSVKEMKERLGEIFEDKQELAQFLRSPDTKAFILGNLPESIDASYRDIIDQSPFMPAAAQALMMIIFRDGFSLSEEEGLWHAYQLSRKFPVVLKEFKTVVTYDVTTNQLVWRY